MSLQEFRLEEFDFENIGALPYKIKLIVSLLLVIVGFLVGAFLFCRTDFYIWQNKLSNKDKLKSELSQNYHQAKNSSQYEAQIKKIKRERQRISIQLPQKGEVANLLENITAQAILSKVKPIKLVPGKAEKVSFYMVQPFNLIISGKYHDIGQFISGIVGLPRIITLHDFSMTLDKKKLEKKEGVDFIEDISMKIEIKIYWYNEN